ncbi:helix-turn-helix domain-containing protein [Ferrovibrio sp.]|uniref:helix-turn-helix domain-containing protein n=1 Tax=Ferrovibrio sp. TaxID=1917215 RepID=UPI00311F0243
MRQILIEVCRERQARPEEIRGPRRFKELFIVRAEAMRRMHDEAGYSLPQIGRFFSGRDHTSVLNAVRRARKIRARGE